MKAVCLFLLVSGFCFSQNKEKECASKIAVIDSLATAGKFDDAAKLLRGASKCQSEKLYQAIEKIGMYQLQFHATPEEKSKQVASLLQNFANYDKNYPANKNGNLIKSAMLLNKYDAQRTDEIFTCLDKAFATRRDEFSEADPLYLYFTFFYNRYTPDGPVTEDQLFEKQDDVAIRLLQLEDKSDSKREYETALSAIQASLSQIATCGKISVYYDKVFEQKKSDPYWLRRASENLFSRRCTANPVFLKV